jgi:hypothetical protein
MSSITDPRMIEAFQWITRRQAVRLEGLGMKHSSGRSVTSICKKALGLKTNALRADVIKAIEAKIKSLCPEWEPRQ